jgi:hypothetical protein
MGCLLFVYFLLTKSCFLLQKVFLLFSFTFTYLLRFSIFSSVLVSKLYLFDVVNVNVSERNAEKKLKKVSRLNFFPKKLLMRFKKFQL